MHTLFEFQMCKLSETQEPFLINNWYNHLLLTSNAMFNHASMLFKSYLHFPCVRPKDTNWPNFNNALSISFENTSILIYGITLLDYSKTFSYANCLTTRMYDTYTLQATLSGLLSSDSIFYIKCLCVTCTDFVYSTAAESCVG